MDVTHSQIQTYLLQNRLDRISQTVENKMFFSNTNLARLKMGWGYLLLFGILTLCARIALGHVVQESSYGLTEIIGILAVLAGQWANWAFGESRSSSTKEIATPIEEVKSDIPA